MTFHHRLLAISAVTFGLASLAGPTHAQTTASAAEAKASSPRRAATAEEAIRPFQVSIPDAALADLRQRIAATRWPERETVADQSQGVQLAKIQELVRYWGTDYDWRRAEARLNALPQFVTTIDGVDIHFLHIRSKHPNAMPLIITHGWPGSVFELLKVVGPLTDPTAHGGRAEDAFDVVIPSMPGYGFSGKPMGTGWGPEHIGTAWDVLMKRLGYTRYVSQGGDWGSVVASAMGRQAPQGLLGIHVNMPATVPPDVAKALSSGAPVPRGLSAAEKAAAASLDKLYKKGGGYAAMMVTRPQTVGYGLADSPAGQAAWMYDKFAAWTFSGGDPERSLTKDEMLDDITLYWLTNSATSSAQLYWENDNNNFNAVEQKTADIKVPVAVTVFPGEIYRAPRSWTERSYRKLVYFNDVDKGGHFAAWEEPQLFASEMRAAFRSLR
ncbi:multidrug MFS transporter [Variovorax sp. WS11]|uniref:epoxide hydrolase family protein n=1 Tax=Variovorax sp. WS11 TaxID=1105204 RepID=UPI000D0CDE60|nr:epoxide hydrolase family protein [Variovorax sp. WS11]NDZ16062.1 epoxide hydrolase [Variovorax sp. WS11]PSL83260.1 multidrug MFS transporter [Variovorax sp. WS11]